MNDTMKPLIIFLSAISLILGIIFFSKLSHDRSNNRVREQIATTLLESRGYKSVTIFNMHLNLIDYPCYHTISLWNNWNRRRDIDMVFRAVKDNKVVEGYLCINFFETLQAMVEKKLPKRK